MHTRTKRCSTLGAHPKPLLLAVSAMPSFLKDLRDLRRRSKGSFKTSDTNGSSGNTSSNDGGSDDQPQVNQSSSTLNSFFDKQSPPTTLSSQKSRSSGHLPRLSNGTKTPPLTTDRPRLPSSHSQRYSLVGTNGQNGDLPKQIPATSPLAPRVVSVSDGSWVSCSFAVVRHSVC